MILREVTIKDSDLLLKWANDPVVRQNSFQTHEILPEEHYAWFNNVLHSTNIRIYILYDQKPVGTVRVKYSGGTAEISYSICSEFRGKGYGTKIIQFAELEIIRNHEIGCILAEVKDANIASRRIFQKLNYYETNHDGYWQYTKQLKEVFGFRVDVNEQVATGHAMRCITYAKELINKYGAIVLFFVADDNGKIFIEQRGMTAVCLNSQFDELDLEIELLKKQICAYRITNLIIDSYFVTYSYLKNLKSRVKITYIDDILKFAYPVDVLINYNIYADKKAYEKLYDGECPELFLGLKYAPLRAEFKSVKHIVRDKVSNVLITTGGADKFNIAGTISDFLLSCEELNDITFHIVSGSFADSTSNNERIVVHKNVTNMAQLMMGCDIIISAGGFTLYEACACGVPTISISFADNQLMNVKKFDQMGLIPYAGDFRVNSAEVLKNMKSVLLEFLETKLERINRQKELLKLIK